MLPEEITALGDLLARLMATRETATCRPVQLHTDRGAMMIVHAPEVSALTIVSAGPGGFAQQRHYLIIEAHESGDLGATATVYAPVQGGGRQPFV